MDHTTEKNVTEAIHHTEMPQILEINIKEEWQSTEIDEMKHEPEETPENLDQYQGHNFSNSDADIITINVKREPVTDNSEDSSAVICSQMHCLVKDGLIEKKTYSEYDNSSSGGHLSSIYHDNIHGSVTYKKQDILTPGEEADVPITGDNQGVNLYKTHCNVISYKRRGTQSSVQKKPKIYECNECHKMYALKANLPKHINIAHETREKSYECYKCCKIFPNKNYIRRHLKIFHEETKHECKECHRMFRETSNLIKHVKTVHHRIKTHQCDQCKKVFSEKSKLRQHIDNVHNHVKSYACNICLRKFSRMENLKVHVKSIHKGIKAKCSKCNKILFDSASLKKHINRVHKANKSEGV